MKKISILAAGIFFLFLSFGANAQPKTGADYFEGKWNVLVTGTPYGDLKRIYVFEKKDNTLTGTVQDSTGREIAKVDKIELKDNEVTFYYHAMGTDVSVTLTREDDDHVTGSVLGMFEAKGKRIK